MNLREFLRENLSNEQRQALKLSLPGLWPDLERGRLNDRDVAARGANGDEEALKLIWSCLHSTFFIRVIRLRSKQECARPCSLAEIDQLPCRWSGKVLKAFFEGLTREEGKELRLYIQGHPANGGLLPWLASRLHQQLHPQLLEEAGFGPLDPSALPEQAQALFKQNPLYRLIFVNRWLWGLPELEALQEILPEPVAEPILAHMVETLDDALLESPELERLLSVLAARRRKRRSSGIPLKLDTAPKELSPL